MGAIHLHVGAERGGATSARNAFVIKVLDPVLGPVADRVREVEGGWQRRLVGPAMQPAFQEDGHFGSGDERGRAEAHRGAGTAAGDTCVVDGVDVWRGPVIIRDVHENRVNADDQSEVLSRIRAEPTRGGEGQGVGAARPEGGRAA